MQSKLETPPLEAIRRAADAVRVMDLAEFEARRGEVVEMLECAGDFLSLQAKALAGNHSAVAVPFDPKREAAGSAKAIAAHMDGVAGLETRRAKVLRTLGRIGWALYFFALGLGLGLGNSKG